MAKLNLPDGYYLLPGDGKAPAAPGKRWSVPNNNSYYMWVFVKDGAPVSMLPLITQEDAKYLEARYGTGAESHHAVHTFSYRNYLETVSSHWDPGVEQLLRTFEKQSEVSTTKVAAGAIGAIFAINIAKNLLKKKSVKQQKQARQETIGVK